MTGSRTGTTAPANLAAPLLSLSGAGLHPAVIGRLETCPTILARGRGSPMRRGQSTGGQSPRGKVGGAFTVALVVIAVTAACALAGFYLGRNVLGEQYLRRGVSKLRAQPMALVTPRAQVGESPVIEEPPPLGEPEAPASAQGTVPAFRRKTGTVPAGDSPRGDSPSAAQGGPTLQLGCFLDRERASVLLQDLRNRGYSATLRSERQGQSTLHRVTMGALSPEQARILASDLKREGYEVIVVGGAPHREQPGTVAPR